MERRKNSRRKREEDDAILDWFSSLGPLLRRSYKHFLNSFSLPFDIEFLYILTNKTVLGMLLIMAMKDFKDAFYMSNKTNINYSRVALIFRNIFQKFLNGLKNIYIYEILKKMACGDSRQI